MEKDKRPSRSDERTRDIQHAFVNCRLREINSLANMRDLREKTMEELRKDLGYEWSKKAPIPPALRERLRERFVHMTAQLQQARLTINFEAHRWFSNENNYELYTQMYERAIQGSTATGAVVVLTGNKDNPALTRVEADETVSFPAGWQKSSGSGSLGASASGKPAQRGALMRTSRSPGGSVDHFRQHGLIGEMSFGKPIDVSDPGMAENTRLMAGNPHFNPRTKQVFAALDYGHRPHGAVIGYGYSFLELNNKFKTNAIYFAGDTFFATKAAGMQTTAGHQLSFDLLAALYLHAKNNPHTSGCLPQALRESCLNDARLPDVPADIFSAGKLLVEAHLFEPVKFEGGVDRVHLSRKSIEKGVDLYDEKRWETLKANCAKFAARNHCGVNLLDDPLLDRR